MTRNKALGPNPFAPRTAAAAAISSHVALLGCPASPSSVLALARGPPDGGTSSIPGSTYMAAI